MKRLIARGGNGQTGGQGKNGDPGTVHLAEPGQPKWEGFPSSGIPGHTFPPGTVYVELQSDLASGIGGYKRSADNGKPAKPAGKPGEPGGGGRITSTIAGLDEFIDVTGGTSGTPGTLAIGGDPGTPKDAKWVLQCTRHHFC
jgi:hypothetical protein